MDDNFLEKSIFLYQPIRKRDRKLIFFISNEYFDNIPEKKNVLEENLRERSQL